VRQFGGVTGDGTDALVDRVAPARATTIPTRIELDGVLVADSIATVLVGGRCL
jgi:hypothetical protein